MNKKDNIIKLSNNILKRNKYKMDLHSQKLIMMLFHTKKKQLLNLPELYDFDGNFVAEEIREGLYNIIEEPINLFYNDLKKLFGNKRMSFNQIIKKFEKFSGSIIWLEKGKPKTIIPINRKIQIDEENKSLIFYLNKELENYIIAVFKNYCEIDLDIYLQLKSKYQIRMYEYICLYDCTSDEFKRKKTIKDIRDFFDVPDSYEFTNINQMVLTPSIKALNKILIKNYQFLKLKKLKTDNNNPKLITHIIINLEKIQVS